MSENQQTQPNVIVVVADTLRTAFLGCYGNDWIHTPSIDRFAQQSVRFTRAHPECLPTIPTRRTLHSGRRAFPFNDYRPVPWDNVYLPGWQPMNTGESTIAETLQQAGYHTGFVADVPHYFVPGMNFTRGFQQWEFVRGQAEDRWHAVADADPALLDRYRAGAPDRIAAHLVNVRPQLPEEEWPTARTFQWAIDFLRHNHPPGRNKDTSPFYLYVDSFTPHETWEAPLHYYDLYGTRAQREPICLTAAYGPFADQYDDRIPSIRANYAGLVTMVDSWFGRLLNTVDQLGLRNNTLVFFFSDHGTNFGENPDGIMGKPADYMYPGTMNIPLLMRHPAGVGAGQVRDEFVYTLDVPATILAAASQQSADPVEGQSLLPLLEENGEFARREYLTCRYGNAVWYRDDRSWFFDAVDWQTPSNGRQPITRLFDLETDPDCRLNIVGHSPERVALARQRILADAGGHLNYYQRQDSTDALGRPQFSSR
ncbi:MAG: sulfatase [Caldilineaceae bacterium SB0675_bin_29]|uniref:Sulfatase n=1 Tax=Caldilineaceae bacterium SB0675_bin_29 TaxID=2605266 RepID=A0A6B1FY45_9CHLR|nr:sulfatase [Caldilineaceae bacterium SB0675_bin_29]